MPHKQQALRDPIRIVAAPPALACSRSTRARAVEATPRSSRPATRRHRYGDRARSGRLSPPRCTRRCPGGSARSSAWKPPRTAARALRRHRERRRGPARRRTCAHLLAAVLEDPRGADRGDCATRASRASAARHFRLPRSSRLARIRGDASRPEWRRMRTLDLLRRCADARARPTTWCSARNCCCLRCRPSRAVIADRGRQARVAIAAMQRSTRSRRRTLDCNSWSCRRSIRAAPNAS